MRPSILVGGETLVDLFPATEGPLASVEFLQRRAGGAPANVAVALNRLQEPAFLWSRVGTDAFGEHLLAVLEEHDVPLRAVQTDPVRKTAHTLVGKDADGDQSFTFFKEQSATMAMDAAMVSDELLESVEWFHFGGVLLSESQGRTAMFEVARRARAHGCTVSFDPNTRRDLWESKDAVRATLEDALTLADVVKTDESDLSPVFDAEHDSQSLARSILDYGPHTAVVTQGAAGALAVASADAPYGPAMIDQPGFEVAVEDSTGAGDAFTAGLISKLTVEEPDLARSVRFASAVGALTTTSTGAMTALPTASSAIQFLDTSSEA